jgi:hypothetical protein
MTIDTIVNQLENSRIAASFIHRDDVSGTIMTNHRIRASIDEPLQPNETPVYSISKPDHGQKTAQINVDDYLTKHYPLNTVTTARSREFHPDISVHVSAYPAPELIAEITLDDILNELDI